MTDQLNSSTIHGGSEAALTLTLKRNKRTLFVDRASQSWVVQDLGGEFWLVPAGEDPWNHRQPIVVTQDVQLEPVPSHYLSMLRIPR